MDSYNFWDNFWGFMTFAEHRDGKNLQVSVQVPMHLVIYDYIINLPMCWLDMVSSLKTMVGWTDGQSKLWTK